MKEKMFRMSGQVRFDKELEKTDVVSLGGFTMTFTGKTVDFDLLRLERNINTDDPKVLDFELLYPDYSSFGEGYKDSVGLYNLDIEDFAHLEGIEEFYVYTGEPGEERIFPVEVINLSFSSDEVEGGFIADYPNLHYRDPEWKDMTPDIWKDGLVIPSEITGSTDVFVNPATLSFIRDKMQEDDGRNIVDSYNERDENLVTLALSPDDYRKIAEDVEKYISSNTGEVEADAVRAVVRAANQYQCVLG